MVFYIISEDRQKLADFCLAAERTGLLWKASAKSCQCVGRGAAQEKAAHILAELTFGLWEQRWLNTLARQRYDCFNNPELRLLINKAVGLTQEDSFCWGLFAGERRHQRLSAALFEHLRHSSHLNIEGFWRFRMEGYREYLQTLLSIAADDVLREQEDEEYLRLLSSFMNTQPPGGHIHVFLLRQGRYDICVQGQEGLSYIEGGRLYGCEDLLLYALLQLAPRHLWVHTEQPLEPALHQLLEEIFGPRLSWDISNLG